MYLSFKLMTWLILTSIKSCCSTNCGWYKLLNEQKQNVQLAWLSLFPNMTSRDSRIECKFLCYDLTQMCGIRMFRTSKPKGQIDNDDDFQILHDRPFALLFLAPLQVLGLSVLVPKNLPPEKKNCCQFAGGRGVGVWKEMTDASWSSHSLTVLLSVMFLVI